mgnify:CR=1 FL=1
MEKVINILGSGVMGEQIAALFYLGGYSVCIWDMKEVDEKKIFYQAKLLKRILKEFGEGRLKIVNKLSDLTDCPTIESVAENLDVKKSLIREIKKSIRKPVFSNTSSYIPSEIGEGVNALHFFNPIALKIVEYHLCEDVADNQTDEARHILNFLRDKGYELIHVKENRGYIGNNLVFNIISEYFRLIEQYKYRPEDVDKMYSVLFPGGKVSDLIDMIGIDTVFKILNNLWEENRNLYIPLSLKTALEKNILGKKNKTSVLNIIKSVKE